jgi:hypothetical protein
MRFMIIRKADARTEAGVPPSGELTVLEPSARGMRVRLSDGKITVTDGPFAETNQLVAGFTVIEAASREEALRWLERWPADTGDGEVELEMHRLYEMSDFPVDPTEQPGGWRDEEQRFRDAEETAGPPPAKPGTTRYIVMLKADRRTESGAPPNGKTLAAMGALMTDLADAGALVGGDGLKPSANSARVKFRAGKAHVIDGPFAESKELVAGYTLIQVGSRHEAIDFARRWLLIHVDGTELTEGELEIRAFLS